MLEELNNYGKMLARKIYIDNKEYFGIQDDLFLFKLSEENFIFLIEEENKDILTTEENKVLFNVKNPTIKFLQDEEKIKKVKKLLPYQIFSLIIRANEINHVSNEVQEFADFLTKGLTEVYTREFAKKYNIEIENQQEENKEFAEILLNNIPEEMDKDKMVFQNNALYMAECYELKTKKNLYKLYEERYKKEQAIEGPILKREKNGYLAPIMIIASCLIGGIILGTVLLG